LRLPVGTRSAFVEGYDKMEKNNFSSWHHHKVRRGESLGVIARQYGIKVSELQQANDMKGSRIRAGQSLLIPIKVTPKAKSNVGKKPEKVRIYIVKLGDNLASVARKFGVSQESLRTWNSMDAASIVNAGDTLFVSKPELKPAAEVSRPKLSKGEKYVVQEGDNYASIAKAYDVPVVLLMQENQGFTRRLAVGDSLTIPEFVRSSKPTLKPSKSDKTSTSKAPKAAKNSAEKVSVYVVQPGDNLSVIARKFGTTVAKLQSLNNMGKSTNLNVGQRLKVSGEHEADFKIHTVKKGEGLWDIARQYNVTIEDIVKWNGLNDTKLKVGERLKIKR
jgi:membrane-bound lytic murein transglycosylase D